MGRCDVSYLSSRISSGCSGSRELVQSGGRGVKCGEWKPCSVTKETLTCSESQFNTWELDSTEVPTCSCHYVRKEFFHELSKPPTFNMWKTVLNCFSPPFCSYSSEISKCGLSLGSSSTHKHAILNKTIVKEIHLLDFICILYNDLYQEWQSSAF